MNVDRRPPYPPRPLPEGRRDPHPLRQPPRTQPRQQLVGRHPSEAFGEPEDEDAGGSSPKSFPNSSRSSSPMPDSFCATPNNRSRTTDDMALSVGMSCSLKSRVPRSSTTVSATSFARASIKLNVRLLFFCTRHDDSYWSRCFPVKPWTITVPPNSGISTVCRGSAGRAAKNCSRVRGVVVIQISPPVRGTGRLLTPSAGGRRAGQEPAQLCRRRRRIEPSRHALRILSPLRLAHLRKEPINADRAEIPAARRG